MTNPNDRSPHTDVIRISYKHRRQKQTLHTTPALLIVMP
jgi:hypothetical protein